MDDTAPVTPDTPDTSAPNGTPDTQTINWEQRYNDLRPKFDQTAQEAAQLRAERERLQTDEDYQRQLLQQLGYEIEDPNQGAPDPTEDLRRQIAELSSWKENLTQEQLQAQQLQQINASVEEQFRSTAPELDPGTREWVETKALSMAPRDDGMPDIQGAYKAFQDWELERQKQWRASKRRAPHITPGGQQGTSAPNLDDQQARRDWMASQLDALNAD
jgi:hypothetical protein